MDDDSLELLANIRFVKKPIFVKPIKEKKIIDEKDEIIELLQERLKMEKNKYGISVKQNTVDNRANSEWELKALEEMLDGLIYTATTIIRYRRKKTNEIIKASIHETDTNVINIEKTIIEKEILHDSTINNTKVIDDMNDTNDTNNTNDMNDTNDTNNTNDMNDTNDTNNVVKPILYDTTIDKSMIHHTTIEKNKMSKSCLNPDENTKTIKMIRHHK